MTAHFIVEIVLRAWNDLEMFGSLTVPTLATIDGNGGMDKNIIYAVLHESIYCQGWVKADLQHCSLF
jgi:proline iminopeptidase